MANTVQIKRGNTPSVNAHTGPSGEIIYNLDTGRLHAQDGITAGGHPHALVRDVNFKANASVNIIAGAGTVGGGDLSADRTIALSHASLLSLAKADTAVQPATTITAGTGLTGGGNLAANRTVALNAASIASLGKADTAIQAPGGSTGQILAKNSATTNDVGWVSSEAATAVSYGPQTLTESQKWQALANIGAGTFRWNWIINGDFTINQRGGVKKPANGVYGYDRWKGHPSGIVQVVEALPAGEYTLTWSGGGNGTFGVVTGVSPIKATVSAGNHSVVVPQTATKVSLVEGDATSETDPFSPRHIQQELALCQRYYEKVTDRNWLTFQTGSVMRLGSSYAVTKRIIPTLSSTFSTTGGVLSGLSSINIEISLTEAVIGYVTPTAPGYGFATITIAADAEF